MRFLKVLSVNEVKERLAAVFASFTLSIESVDIIDSFDRILAQDIISPVAVPQFNRSTVDGYAIQSSDSHGTSDFMPSFLKVVGTVSMGEKTALQVSAGEAVYVPTGGMIPEGADSVVMIEHIEKLDEDTIAIYKPVCVGENIIYAGDDIKNGQFVLEKGKKLTPQDIGVLAAIGIPKVNVYAKPRVYIVSTGDEIIDLDEELTPGKIRDINGYVLSMLVKKMGGEVVNKVIVNDDFELLKREVKKGMDTSDIIIISGGSSVGTRDFTYDVINSFEGKGVFVHGVSIKPGKPTIIGEIEGKAVFGLPGHPVSAMIVFKAFVEYFIKSIMKAKENLNMTKAILDFNVHSSPGKETYQVVNLQERDGKLYAVPSFGKSGLITLLSKASGYIIIQDHIEGLNKGEEVDVYFL
ncbi:MAG: molybdopterin molybdotransferase [Petroclostridium sp.]|jgi:molybdopterin molybdotransferase|uniref:molybdopterin molybdotransferase MoeA n=1 Tax=Petroclostridium xylanilyticum TaxID=1792311 RepID=UPI000B9945AB|nr:gephyrin-like molybdotransferase Glp [Petroclostridium xylanilyticum]MBZ4646772.1 moeA4 [Clostridia bacterium]MDK2809506.1 molybdopterin molybdotransferase [Petroclostridium sp.]